MNVVAAPLCLVLALLLAIGGFAVLAREAPQPSMALHRAHLEGDDQQRDLLESQLTKKKLQRKVLIGSLFGMAVVMAATGLAVMRPSR